MYKPLPCQELPKMNKMHETKPLCVQSNLDSQQCRL